MPGPVYGQNYSVRLPLRDAERFEALATASGLKRSELLRHLILRAIDDRPVLNGAELRRARTIGRGGA